MSQEMTLSSASQKDIGITAFELANESHAKIKKGIGLTLGFLGAAALLITFPVSGVGFLGVLAGGIAVATGAATIGEYRAERLMRKIVGNAAQDGFVETLNEDADHLTARNEKDSKYALWSMAAVVATAAVSLVFPPAAPVLSVLHTLATAGWGYFGIKSAVGSPSAKNTAELASHAEDLADKDKADRWFAAANDAKSSLSIPSPGPDFDRAVTPTVENDAPAKKALNRIYRI